MRLIIYRFVNQRYLCLKRNHPEVEEPGLAPGEDEGQQDQHHVVGDWVVVPLVLKYLKQAELAFIFSLEFPR